MIRKAIVLTILCCLLGFSGPVRAGLDEQYRDFASLAQACAKEQLETEVRIRNLKKMAGDALDLTIKLGRSHGKLSKDCRMLKVQIQKQEFLGFVLELTSFAYSLTTGPFTQSLTKMGLKAVHNQLFVLSQSLEELGKNLSRKELGQPQAEQEIKAVLGELEARVEELDDVRKRVHQRRVAMLQEIKDLEARLGRLKKNCAEDAARLVQAVTGPPSSGNQDRPAKGGYWQLVNISGGANPPREEQCYARSASGGEGALTFTILNKCTKNKTKFQGQASWSRPSEVLVPGRSYSQEVTVRRLAFDPGLFQDIHLSANLEPGRISCGATAGGGEYRVFLKVGSKSDKGGQRKIFKFTAPDLGYADSISSREIAILFCTNGGGYKYLYRWVPKGGRPEQVKLPSVRGDGGQGGGGQDRDLPESDPLGGRWDDPVAQGAWTFTPLKKGGYQAEFRGMIQARGRAILQGRSLVIDLQVEKEKIRYRLTLSEDGSQARGSWTSSNGETQEAVLTLRGQGAKVPEGQDASIRIRPGEKPLKLFGNGNPKVVRNNPTASTVLSFSSPQLITRITTYHFNFNKGDEPGTIGLKDSRGRVYGPWKALAKNPDGTPPRRYWTAAPMEVLPPGKYRVVDSNPATWSHNSASGGRGIVWVEGVPR